MPDDCNKSIRFDGNVEQANRTEIYKLYAETSYLEDFGEKTIQSELEQFVEDMGTFEGMDMTDFSFKIGGDDSVLS